jgi:glycosyltransferase involved in cell wall biosynthesis
VIRVLELRSVRGTGGGPEKTILCGAALADRRRFAITVCYLRDARDASFEVARRPEVAGLDYVEIVEQHSVDVGVWPQLRGLVRERQIDIVHAHEYKTDLLAWMLSSTERVIPLATVHGWTGHSRRERWLYYPADKRLLVRYPQLVAVSSEIRNELVRHGASPRRVAVVLNGVDAAAFRRDRTREADVRRALNLRTDDVVIGAVGRLEPQKRFDLLLEAFARLYDARPSLRLVVAGDGSLRTALVGKAEHLGLSSVCRFLGHREDVRDLHHAFDFFVQSSEYEGTPNAVLEAMALETPVVATAAGGTAEVLRDDVDGIVVPVGDAAALHHAIERALGDPAATLRRVHAARQRVETDLSFEVRTRRLESIYDELAGAREERTSAIAHA